MKKCKFLRKAYLMTRYHLQCNENLEIDYPAGRTNKKPSSQLDIITACFSDSLNLSAKQGSKLFAEYSIKHIDVRGNEIFKAVLDNKVLFNVDIEARTYTIFGSTQKIFIY